MYESSSAGVASGPCHVAIIMDGNGRWARAGACRGSPATSAGADRVREIVEACPDLGDHAT